MTKKPITSAPERDPEDERELLRRAQAGDRKAFGDVVEAHRERLFCAALGLLRNPEDARDVSQEAFIRAFKALDRFELKRPFYPWLYRILHNLCMDQLRRQGPRRQLSLEAIIEETGDRFASPASDADSLRERMHQRQMAEHLRSCLNDLKPEFREIILMKHFEDMPYNEIAEALEIPVGTVMSRLFHARKALAKLMERYRE